MAAEREPINVVVQPNHAAASLRFPCFDGLRAVAALSVFAFHFLGLGDRSWLHGALLVWVWRLGLQGVGIFFVISGFLLYRPFVERALSGDRSPSTSQFWRRRFARIFPAYWIALSAYVYGFGMFKIHGFANFVTYYGLLQNYRAGYAFYGLGIAWTLGIELTFYLALPLISRIARVVSGEQRDSRRVVGRQLTVVASLAAGGLLVRGLNFWGLMGARPTRGTWFPIQVIVDNVFGYLDWFGVGMAFAVIYAGVANAKSLPPWFDLFARHPGMCWTVALISYAIQTKLRTGPAAQFALTILVEVTAASLVFPAIFGPQDRGIIRALLRSRPLSYLGRVSYGIYLWHFIIIILSARWIASGSLPDVFVLRLATVATLTVGVATASFYLIERPIISWSQHNPRPAPREPASTAPRRTIGNER